MEEPQPIGAESLRVAGLLPAGGVLLPAVQETPPPE